MQPDQSDRIQILPDAVKHKIAAGEVVEGPFSVLKELMENSLDAGATAIDVEVEDGGFRKIYVRDDGCGIRREDMGLVAREHATSKMRRIEDIDSIATYGFRGEALSSIASISRLTVLSRRRDEEMGAKLSGAGGEAEPGDYAGPSGTTVIAENLFYNVPARKKFLKSRQRELRSLRETFLKVSLACPGVSFSFTVDGERRLSLPAAPDRGERIAQVYGKPLREQLIEESISDVKAEVTGYFSGPSFHRPSRTLQHLYINDRHIEFRNFGFLLSRAYDSLLRHGEHPAAFLFIRIDPELVDVNVHPAKREVRFFDQSYINGLILGLARKALGARSHRVDPDLFTGGVQSPGADRFPASEGERGDDSSAPGFPSAGRGLFSAEFRGAVRDGRTLYESAASDGVAYLGALFETYLLFRDLEGLILIDFHAAHERFIYDRLMETDADLETQRLIFPHTPDLTPQECAAVLDNLDSFSAAGFDVEQIGEADLAVRGVPAAAPKLDVDAFFHDLLDSLDREMDSAGWRERIAEKTACHSARRSGDELSPSEALSLARQSLSGLHDLRCPHGRPYLYRLERGDIERLFKRK